MHGRRLDATTDANRTIALPLVDAARQLGISRDALRKRLDRGTLRGTKRRGTWYVYLDAADATTDAIADATRTPMDAVPDAGRTPPDAAPDSHAGEVALLQDEVLFLREQLRARDAELERRAAAESELRRLLALALQVQPVLAAGPTGNGAGGDGHAPHATDRHAPPRPWWRRWWPGSRTI